MGSMQRCTRAARSLQIIIVSLGFVVQPSMAKAEPPNTTAAVLPIVSLQFDADNGVLWKATPRLVARSLDKGQTWRPVQLPALEQVQIASLAISSGGAKTIYVASVGSGVLRSTDGGRTWVARNQGLPHGDVVTLAAHSRSPLIIYAYVRRTGIFRSVNAGDTWRFLNHGPAEPVVQLTHSNLSGKAGAGWLFAATRKGVRRAMDCFCRWRSVGPLAFSILAVAADPTLPTRIYAAAREGFFISPDGGAHWIKMRSPVAPITALASTSSSELFGAINGKLIRSMNRGVTWDFITN